MNIKQTATQSDFRLIGLSKPNSATLQFLYSDEETFWAKCNMTPETFQAMFDYCEGNWDELKIAEVEHDGFYDDRTPINPVVIGIRIWDIRLPKKK